MCHHLGLLQGESYALCCSWRGMKADSVAYLKGMTLLPTKTVSMPSFTLRGGGRSVASKANLESNVSFQPVPGQCWHCLAGACIFSSLFPFGQHFIPCNGCGYLPFSQHGASTFGILRLILSALVSLSFMTGSLKKD